ncbi:MAG: YbaB/EbfC family nucleoid-associated protein [Mycobacterium sp.]|uniref:YbaB/EbfC family nucleoid-associated protein n=1 Tax=Mycobacterium sp. TaxID=1785 RepID=UPI001EC00EE0|nr:YbaB/EbfC family nucleoid-associated protein [Mycobacterium sp.]MBV8787396.1 YbaB/EbfC family nucleoid-associated protein [Mycobacterium sp.]
MTTDSHPQMAAALEEFQRFNEVLEGQMRRKSTDSFTATDEDQTVEVTINGDSCLIDMHIEAGLLRLGAETVEQRINEALLKAQAEAAANFEVQYEQLVDSLGEIVTSLQSIVGTGEAKPR